MSPVVDILAVGMEEMGTRVLNETICDMIGCDTIGGSTISMSHNNTSILYYEHDDQGDTIWPGSMLQLRRYKSTPRRFVDSVYTTNCTAVYNKEHTKSRCYHTAFNHPNQVEINRNKLNAILLAFVFRNTKPDLSRCCTTFSVVAG